MNLIIVSPALVNDEMRQTEDASLFLNIFGVNNPVLKVLDFLMDNQAFDYSKTDIAEGAGISRSTLFNIWSNLEDNCLVIATREVGRAKMYRLNKDSPIVKKFVELDRTISEHCASRATSTKKAGSSPETGQPTTASQP